MRERTKIWLSIATFFVCAGLILFVVVMTLYKWDFSKLNTVKHTEDTHTVTEEFTSVSLNTQSADVNFLPSKDGACSVVCKYPEKWNHSVSVKDGTLTVFMENTSTWIDTIGFSFVSPKITVYLPEKTYNTLLADVNSGDLQISKEITFDAIDIKAGSGKVTCLSSPAKDLRVKTGSGDIVLSSVTANNIAIETESGEVSFSRCTPRESVTITTSSGDVKGDFSVAVQCNAKSSSGEVSVPKGTAGVACTISTNSGDIKVTATDAPVPSPTEAPATPTPTEEPAEPTPTEKPHGPVVVHKVENPAENTAAIIANTLVIYPKDAVVKVYVTRTAEETSFLRGSTVGGIGVTDGKPDSRFTFVLDHDTIVDETVSFRFTVGDLLDFAEAEGQKKLYVIVDDASGYRLTGVDIEYEQ